MPSLSELPGNIKRKKLTKALERLGFIVDKRGGNGSHCKIIWPRNDKCVTLQSEVRKDVLYYFLKELELISGITWNQIKEKL